MGTHGSRQRWWGRGLCLLGVLLASGCTATITKKSGATLEGFIARADKDAVYLVKEPNTWTPQSEAAREEIAVPWAEVDEIDHPGFPVAMASTVLATASWTLFAVGRNADKYGDLDDIGLVLAGWAGLFMAIPASIVALTAWATWGRSKLAARRPGPAVIIAPQVLTDGGQRYYGAAVGWAW